MSPTAEQRKRALAIARPLKNDPAKLIAESLRLLTTGQALMAYELCRAAPRCVVAASRRDLLALREGLDSWEKTDSYGSFISGVAWREGTLSDAEIHSWTKSKDLWVRRAALVSTVPLNQPARGATNPKGEPARTLAICEALLDDREDMVVKGLSWALRVLAQQNPEPVRAFMKKHEGRLAARVIREVRNKLTTGLKNPKKSPANQKSKARAKKPAIT